MKTIAVALVLLSLVACGPSQEPLTPEAAKLLIADAVTIPESLLKEVTMAGPNFHSATASNFPFSLLLLSVPFGGDSDDMRRLRAADAPPPKPKEMWISSGAGRLALLTAEHITEVTVEEGEGVATGSFRWHRPKYLEARGTFSARLSETGWEVVELGLPAAKAGVALRADGTWGIIEGL